MATLMFSTVGRAIGGRIGATVGAIAGQIVDQSLFGPAPRQGARLAELSVQSSSYGATIPKVFGRARIAGSVIWSTDLIETTARQSNGKGRPATETYSYSASFAVLLSARRILRVERIWADGNLLRGAAGDLKVPLAALRVHDGNEDQATDPLIASAEGADAPAYRGLAYAVLEGLQLGDYGNRIPSLSFEVVADDAAVPVGAMLGALGDVDSTGGPPVVGCVATGDSLRSLAETMSSAVSMYVRGTNRAGIVFAAVPATAPVAEGFGATADTARAPRTTTETAPLDGVARTLTLGYADAGRDYQAGVQRARREGPGQRNARIDAPFILDAPAAAAMAVQALARTVVERARMTLCLPWRAMTLRPGDAIAVGGQRWRIAESRFERMVVNLDLVRMKPTLASGGTATPGRSVSQSDVPAGATSLAVIDLPPLSDVAADRPSVAVFAGGSSPGWRSATLLASVDAGVTFVSAGTTAAPAVLGATIDSLPVGTAYLADRANSVRVQLIDHAAILSDADVDSLLAGANRAMIGDELLQFGRAVPEGGGRWRLSELWRGRRGTEDRIVAHAAGSRFVLIDAASATALHADLARPGVTVMASGIGDTLPYPVASSAVADRAILPLAPEHLAACRHAGGDTAVSWVRRSRAGWPWANGVDAPLAEEAEAYRVTLTAGPRAIECEVAASAFIYAAADRAADIADGATQAVVRIAQRGTFGFSPSTTLVIPLV